MSKKLLPAWALLLLAWLQPLHIMPWPSWHSEVPAALAVLWIMIVAIWSDRRAEEHFLIPRAAAVPFGLAAYAMLQFAWGQISYLGDALIVSVYLSMAAFAMTIGYRWARNADFRETARAQRSPMEQLAWVVLAGALASMLLAVAQLAGEWTDAPWLFQPDLDRRPGANLGQPNQLATLLLMGLASLALLTKIGRMSRAMTGFLAICILMGVVITESRTALLSLAAMTLWWWWATGPGPRTYSVITAAGGWLSLLTVWWLWPRFLEIWKAEPASSSIAIGSPGGRSVVWPQLLDAVGHHPWLGWGLREVPEAHNAVIHRYPASEPYGYAHNIVLDLALGVGLPLTLILVLVVVRWGWIRLRKVKDPVELYGVALGIPFFVHALTEFPFAYIYLLVAPCLAIGYLEGRLAPQSVIRLRCGAAIAATTALGALLLFSAIEYLEIEEDFRVARFEALRIGKTPEEHQRPKIYMLTQMDAMLRVSRFDPTPSLTLEQIDDLRRAALRFPSTAVQHRYALALALNGQPEEAIRQMMVMRAMHGERHYQKLREAWVELSETKYPQLKALDLP